MLEDKKIKLVTDTIDNNDIDRLINWLSTYPRLTKGRLTNQLEEKWSKWLGVNHSIFCNSGSSANLLMLWALVESNKISRNSKIVVPALSWATDLSPVIQLGMTPILCDANLEDFSVDLNHLEEIFKKENPQVFILVSVLGFVPNMKKIVELCDKYNVILLEDTCESMGSKFNNKKLGTFGLMSSFSTYFGHHISTIEGGFVSTNDETLYEVLKSIRSHGWGRDLSINHNSQLKSDWQVSNFDSLYTFYYSGFNLRSTDLQAFIGLHQIDKLDYICKKRNENYKLYNGLLSNYKSKGFNSNFAYPIISDNKNQIIQKLQDNNIEVRPLICGSMGSQPFYIKEYGEKILPNSSIIDKKGFYVPNHPGLCEEDIIFVSDIIKEKI